MIIVDDFLGNPDEAFLYFEDAEYRDVVNDRDGVTYPLICAEIPNRIKNDIIFNLTHKIMARAPKDPVIFARRSPAGVDVPHKFHNDSSMGDYSMMIYLQDNELGGTGMAVHNETGAYSAHQPPSVIAKVTNDCNDDSKWTVYKKSEMKKNRAVVFDSSMFHVALPIGGFGEGAKARTVLTCFFS